MESFDFSVNRVIFTVGNVMRNVSVPLFEEEATNVALSPFVTNHSRLRGLKNI